MSTTPIPAGFKFCGQCGNQLDPATVTYKSATCIKCGLTVYNSPKPVASALVPVGYRDAHFVPWILGTIIIERGIEPGRGGFALPGGFFDAYESWQEALVRELGEETGIVKPADQVAFHGIATSSNLARHHLIFGVTSLLEVDPNTLELPESVREAFRKRPPEQQREAPSMRVITEPVELAFTSHTEMVKLFFQRFVTR